jgi:O-antigen/teichoic acid export membrane protein
VTSIPVIGIELFLKLDLDYLLSTGVVFILALIYLNVNRHVGVLEGAGKIRDVNFFGALSNIVMFPIWWFGCSSKSVVLCVSLTIAPYLLVGYLCKFKIRKLSPEIPSKSQKIELNESFEKKFLIIILLGKTSYLFDPFLIGLQLDSTQVAIASVYQKFLIGYSVIPQAISPLVMIESHKKVSKSLVQTKKYLIVITLLLTVVYLVTFHGIFETLTRDTVKPIGSLFLIVLVQGITGSIVSHRIQRSLSTAQINDQIKILSITSGLSLICTFLFLPYIGIAISFVTSTLSSLAVYLIVRFRSEN